MPKKFIAICPCGWQKSYNEDNSFNQNPERSAKQGARGHTASTGCDYENIIIEEHPLPQECPVCGKGGKWADGTPTEKLCPDGGCPVTRFDYAGERDE